MKKISEDNSKHIAFIKYFMKNWYRVKLMSFENLSDEEIKFRTDNPVEILMLIKQNFLILLNILKNNLDLI